MSKNLLIARNYTKSMRGEDPQFAAAFEAILNELEDLRGSIPGPDVPPEWIHPNFNALIYSADVGTWDAAAGSVNGFRYRVTDGNHLTLQFTIVSTTITGAPNYLKIQLPEGYIAPITGSQTRSFIETVNNGGVAGTGMVISFPGNNFIAIYKDVNGTPWVAGVTNNSVIGEITLEVSK